MKKITQLVFIDILKNKIVIFYTLLLSILGWSVFSLEDNTTKGILSLLNIILLTIPLICIIFTTIYIFNSSEFIELLVSQPIKRKHIWISMYIGLTCSLCLAFLIGIGLPVLLFCASGMGFFIIGIGLLITFIFCSIAMLCSVYTRDKAKGIGMAIIIWLFLSLIYDGIILFMMFQWADYPIEKPMVVAVALNPIDLARIGMLLQIDESALMGYTGAIFKSLFGSAMGLSISLILLLLWILLPYYFSLRTFNKKDL